MAEKCKDFSNYGYPDERFETVLSENLHCAICSNVFKDPVMCKNEHCFCRACITEHLRNSQNCPCCNQHLSVESLTNAPRIFRNLLSELRIRCDYHERGCEEFVQLGNLASHVATCPKAPVVCANEECSCEINREDQARHESEECRFRKIKCRNCKEMDSMIQEIGANLGDLCEHIMKLNTNVNEKLSEMKTGLSAMENRFEKVEKGYEKVETNLEEMQSKFEKLENRFEKVGNQCHESFHNMISARSDQAIQADLVGEVQVANNPTQNAYIVAGGYGGQRQPLNSVEIFDKSTNSWRQLQPMKKCRADASSVVYNGQLLVTGGVTDGGNILSSIEQFVRNPNPFSPPYWLNFPVNLPRALRGHSSVVYNNRLLVIGGYDDEDKKSHLIYEIQLHFPYTSKVLAEIPSYVNISGCGVVLVDDKIFVFGGETSYNRDSPPSRSSGVTMYDITKNEFKMLEPLPRGVYHTAAVKRGASVIICGGFPPSSYDYRGEVIRYNIETQKSEKLSSMNCFRSECSGIVDGNSVVVMGGNISRTSTSNTVEAFDYSQWRNLPSMNEARRRFVAELV